jgi:hypothetical protein
LFPKHGRSILNFVQRTRLGDVAVFENRQPVTEAKFITKSSLFVLLLGVIRRLELKLISEQKVEIIFVAPLYCQTACWQQAFFVTFIYFSLS